MTTASTEQHAFNRPETSAHRDGSVRRVPLLLQMQACECGAACLGMILAYYGRRVSLEELRMRCGVSRDGSNAANLLSAAQYYGLECSAYKTEPEPLLEKLPLPSIVFWGFNHFVVVEGRRGAEVLICDPAFGHRAVSNEEFDRKFTGVVLTFSRGADFQTGGENVSLRESVLRRLRPVRWPLWFALLASLLLIAPGVAIPAFARVFVDGILVNGYANWWEPLLLWMVAVLVVRTGLVWAQQYYLLRMNEKLASSRSCRFLWQVLRLPIPFFQQRYAAEICQRARSNDHLAMVLSGPLSGAVLNLLMILIYLPVMLCYDPWLTLVAVLTGGAGLYLGSWLMHWSTEANLRLWQNRARVEVATTTALQGIETIKARGMEESAFRRWSGLQARAERSAQEAGGIAQRLGVLPEALLMLARGAVLVIGALRIMDGHLTVGALCAFLILLEFFLTPVMQLMSSGGLLQDAAASLRRIDDVMQTPQDGLFLQDETSPGDNPGTGLLPLPLGKLEFRAVTFGYSPMDPPLIQDLNFTLEPGRRLAITGPSGCGKSTVARLAAGLLQPWSGEILLDGKPRALWSAKDLYAAVALVDQDIFLFEGTVRENITLWDRTVRDEDVAAACRDAALDSDIARRPGGFNAYVAENGENFSGGQRQRLEIARALCGNPRLLILDEAASSLDPLVEEKIGENLRRRGCACLLVAHRLSTLREADEILVLDRGVIVERGGHEALLRANGRYAELMRSGEEDAVLAATERRVAHGD